MDISVCIVNFNSKKQLEKCLNTIKPAIKPLSYEVIIIDNYSKDGSQELIKKHFEKVRLITNNRNNGYTSEINRAMKIGKGKYKLIMNPDSRLMPKSIINLVTFMKQKKRSGIAGPLVLNEDGSFQWSCRRGVARPFAVFCYFLGIAKLFPQYPIFTGYHLNHLDVKEINEVSGVSGSCMLVDQELINDIGYFDERFFAYQEDSDYCLRAINSGWKVYYNPNSMVIHKGGHGGSNSVPFRSIFEWHRSYILYYFKHFSKDYGIVFNSLYFVIMVSKLIFSEILFMIRR
tara:strand:- start:405 stop:1268 length:864 start_codon:yes stop_codon:yes gene_type:complete